MAFVLGLSSACVGNAFLCGADTECGTDGTCESSGYCSFPDTECSSGQRYGEHAGTGLANMCVPLPDTGSSTAPDPSSTSTALPTTEPPLDGDGTTTSGTTTSLGSTTTAETSTTDTGPDESSTGMPIERVTEGLLVLYPFDEGRGAVAHDQGGFGAPLDLTIEGSDFAWVSDGISVVDDVLRSGVPATKIIESCQLTDEFSAEAWITPAAAAAEGPARIITLSNDSSVRNFTVGQGLHLEQTDDYIGRVRTSDKTGDANGGPNLISGSIAATAPTHVVYLRSTEGYDRLYVDGQLQIEGVRTGSFSNWNDTFEFACGNEPLGDRAWQGTLHLVAVYDRALSPEEIVQNFEAGY